MGRIFCEGKMGFGLRILHTMGTSVRHGAAAAWPSSCRLALALCRVTSPRILLGFLFPFAVLQQGHLLPLWWVLGGRGTPSQALSTPGDMDPRERSFIKPCSYLLGNPSAGEQYPPSKCKGFLSPTRGEPRYNPSARGIAFKGE